MELSFPYTEVQLKKRYKILVKKHHPDLNQGSKKSEEMFKYCFKDDFVKKAVLYIESNYHKQFDVGKYAKSIGVSRSHFTTVFTKRIGMSPYNLLMNERIENAKKYLINSDLTISQIATKTGFASIERFSNVFKTKTGMSPKKFRDSVKILT